MNNRRWQIWLSGLAGAWVFLSPFALWQAASTVAAPLSNAAEWNLGLVGLALVGLAVAALVSYRPWEEWIAALGGLWVIASPWIFSFSEATAMTWSAVVAGAIVVVTAIWTVIVNPSARGPD